MNKMRTKLKANNHDYHIGQKIRIRRIQLGMSQQNLGDAIGVSIQQVQKYEKGINKTSCSTMIKIANCLKIKMEYFFHKII